MPEKILSIKLVQKALEARVIEGESLLDATIEHIYASDLMSDVLAFGKSNSILLTGLATKQSVISALMADFKGVVFIRGKLPKDGCDLFAREKNMALLSTRLDMYEACIRIYDALQAGDSQKGNGHVGVEDEVDILLKQEFTINGKDFSNAGMVSTELKEILKKIGLPPPLIRRVGISTYEGELNVIMHARSGNVTLMVSPHFIEVEIRDEGPGIPDIELAMEEGFTTATEEMRAMGFGSGMGLPNIKKNSNDLKVSSVVGKGTTLQMKFLI
jgi:serine/threonine-protein kinase RsbT